MAINRLNVSLSGVQPGGLAKIVPTSVAVGSGSGSVDSSGLVSFSGASYISLNGCFNSNFEHYTIMMWTNTSVFDEIRLRFRVNNADNNSSTYSWQRFSASGSATGAARVTSTTTGFVGYCDATYGSFKLEVFNPNLNSKRTVTQSYSNFFSSTAIEWGASTSVYADTTSFDGISFFPNNGAYNMTGTLRVYGYNN
jgi:hypothetical protein